RRDGPRAQDMATGKEVVNKKGRRDTQYDLEHDCRKGIDRAAPYRRPKFRIAQEKNVVVEPDESLLREERVLVEETDPDAVEHRIKREREQEENGGQGQQGFEQRLR